MHQTFHDPGHTVLAVPVPELYAFVRSRTAYYDPAYLAQDPCFGHAHVTVLAPWVREPTATDLAEVTRIASQTAAFQYRLSQLDTFPNGIIHLLPQPADPFAALTAALVKSFPNCPPYAGQFPRVTPHVTVDAVSSEVTEEVVQSMLSGVVPVVARATHLQLQWWQAGNCHVQQVWELGQPRGTTQ